jgi:hypothetical protein
MDLELFNAFQALVSHGEITHTLGNLRYDAFFDYVCNSDPSRPLTPHHIPPNDGPVRADPDTVQECKLCKPAWIAVHRDGILHAADVLAMHGVAVDVEFPEFVWTHSRARGYSRI